MSSSNKTYPNQIKLESGFKITGNYPIDDRLVVDDYNSLQGLINDRESYEGMIVTVSNDGTYQCLNNSWHKLLTVTNFDKETGEKYLTSENYKTRASSILTDDEDVILLVGGNAGTNKYHRINETGLNQNKWPVYDKNKNYFDDNTTN